MNTEIIKKYNTPPTKGMIYRVASYFSLPLGLGTCFFIGKTLFENKPEYDDQIFWIYFCGIFCVFLVINSLYFLIIHNKWIFHANITDEKIVGYNLSDNKVEITYDEIIKIQKNKILPCIESNYKSLHIVLRGGRKIILWGGMNRYGDLIEEIRKRSLNLESYDYGGLDKNPRVWDDQRWDDDGKPIRNKK